MRLALLALLATPATLDCVEKTAKMDHLALRVHPVSLAPLATLVNLVSLVSVAKMECPVFPEDLEAKEAVATLDPPDLLVFLDLAGPLAQQDHLDLLASAVRGVSAVMADLWDNRDLWALLELKV